MENIVIVGGSSGIGKAILEQSLGKYNCYNISRNEPEIDGAYTHIACDILQDDLPDIEAVDHLVYCPGSINLKPISSLKEDDFLEDYRINVLGATKAIQKYYKKLRKSPTASIVLFSTVAVQQGMPFHASVAASKGALEGITRSLAAEFSPKIRVNAIAPTITDTPLAAKLLRNEEAVQKMKDRHPLGRINSSKEVADLAQFLMSSSAASITGQIIQVDAGLSVKS